MSAKILFRCDADSQSGFGHFSRCINLARHFVEFGSSNIYFLGIFNSFAQKTLKTYGINFRNIQDKERIKSEVVVNLAIEFDILILDSYLFTQEYINTINCKKYRTVYISDTSNLNYVNADLVVNFRIEGYKHTYSESNTLLSIDYFITKPEFRRIRERNMKNSKTHIKSILLFNTGTSSKDNTSHLFLKTIDNIFSNINVTFISKYFKSLSEYNLANNQYKLISPSFDIEKYYDQADIVLSGGGLTKYESSYCLIPNAAFSNTLLQHEDSEILHKKGLCYDLGYIAIPSTMENFERKLTHFLTSAYEQRKIYKNGLKYFHTNSTFKLCNEILKL